MTELLLLLQSSPLAFTVMGAVLGLMVGSFLNVVIHRLPKMMEIGWQQQCAELSGKTPLSHAEDEPAHISPYNLIVPRSACPHCNHVISAWENIPIVSYLLLRGKCPVVCLGAAGSDGHRFRHPTAAGRHHPAAALGRLAVQLVRGLHRFA